MSIKLRVDSRSEHNLHQTNTKWVVMSSVQRRWAWSAAARASEAPRGRASHTTGGGTWRFRIARCERRSRADAGRRRPTRRRLHRRPLERASAGAAGAAATPPTHSESRSRPKREHIAALQNSPLFFSTNVTKDHRIRKTYIRDDRMIERVEQLEDLPLHVSPLRCIRNGKQCLHL